MSSFIRTAQPRTKAGSFFGSFGKLVCLYDANDVARFYANGDTVSNVFDLSGNGYHMTPNATAMPLVTNADGNGNAALRNTVANKYYRNTKFRVMNQPFTQFAVANVTDVTTNRGVFSGGSLNELYWRTLTGNPTLYSGSAEVTIGTAAAGAVHILTGTFNGSNSFGTVNGTQSANANPGTAGTTASAFLGAGIGGAEIFLGDIYIFGMYEGVLPQRELNRLIAVLSTRFNKAVNI